MLCMWLDFQFITLLVTINTTSMRVKYVKHLFVYNGNEWNFSEVTVVADFIMVELNTKESRVEWKR